VATRTEYEKLGRSLKADFPLIGALRKRGAAKTLAARRSDPQVISLLVEALLCGDEQAATTARSALMDLTAPAAIDALCGLWAKERNDQLGQIIVEKDYIAGEPPRLQALSALKCGHRIKADHAAAAKLLGGLLADPDDTVRSGANQALRAVPRGPAQDALCELAIRDPDCAAARICIESGYRPSDQERACLFLFVTRQLDAYFQEDFEFQNLRPQYDRADEHIRELVMAVVRMGDRRCLPFIMRPRKALAECNDQEIKLAIHSCLRHKDWNRLFAACLDLPLKYSFPALQHLHTCGWEPEKPELKSLFKQIARDSQGQELPAPRPVSATSSVFEKWLAEGRSGEFASASEPDLLNRLKEAAPPQGVSIVAALAAKGSLSPTAAEAVAKNEHWLVRLASLATGLTTDIVHDAPHDSNYWINELAGTAGVLEFWPGKATPSDLERLSQAPPEAFAGKLGGVRKVLRTVMGHRVTTGVFTPMEIEAGATDAQFVMVEP
jgi:hypothetical protein